MSAGGLLSRLLWRDAEEDDSSTYSAEEFGTRRPWRKGEPEEVKQSRGFSIQRVAETIAELPSTVPREHAVLIVRRTLAAADIKLSELDVSTRAQESQLSSEIELAKNRQKEVLEKTEETVRPLEEELRRAREACDGVVAYEEKKISRALATLKEVRRVRAFFDLPETEGEENADPIAQDAQPLRVLKTQEEGGGSSPPTAADSKVSVGMSSRATASCKSLLAIEVDAFDEFVTKLRGEHAQESPSCLE